MTFLGIDPSLETGLALVDVDGPDLIACACVKPGSKVPTHERVRWIIDTAWTWLHDQRQRHHIHTFTVAIEYPAVGRTRVAPLQLMLIGGLQDRLRCFDQVVVTPGQAKVAVGVPYRSPRKPVDEVRAILGLDHPIADAKYAREAVSDAVAVALAAHRKIQEDVA